MILFRKQYKAAFNRIFADRTKIDKIFDVAEKSSQKKPKIVPFRYAGTLVAAICIIVAAAMFPNFSDFFVAEEKVYEPIGVVNYGIDKNWDDTVITGGDSKQMPEIEASNRMMRMTDDFAESFVKVEEIIYDLTNGSVTVSIYSKNNEIEAMLGQNNTDVLVLSNTIAFAKKDGMFYEFFASGITEQELKSFINEQI